MQRRAFAATTPPDLDAELADLRLAIARLRLQEQSLLARIEADPEAVLSGARTLPPRPGWPIQRCGQSGAAQDLYQ